jgi:hypothetical protein
MSLYLRAADIQLKGWLATGDPRAGRWRPTGALEAWKGLLPLSLAAAGAGLGGLATASRPLSGVAGIASGLAGVEAVRRLRHHAHSELDVQFTREAVWDVRSDALASRRGAVFWAIVILIALLAAFAVLATIILVLNPR